MRDLQWRTRTVAGAAMSIALVVGACSGNNSGATPSGGGASPSGAATPSGSAPLPSGSGGGGFQPPSNPQTLTVWNPFTGPDGNFFNGIVEDYNTATPSCQVTVQTQPGAEYVQRLEAARDATQLPQVIAAGYDALPGLVENGVLAPIDDFVSTGGYGADMFPEAIWNAGEWKGQRVGIPIDTHTMNFYYNKQLFRDAGLDPEKPPTDKASFEAAIKAIQDKTEADGFQMVASGGGANFLTGIQFAALFYQGGGKWTNDDYSEATFNSKAGVDAAEYLAHLVKDLGVPKVESDAEINAFQQGKNAMVWSGIWETTRYNDALGEDLGVSTIPEIFGPGTWGGSHNLAVTTAGADGGDMQACAYHFIDWFSQNSLQWGAAGQIPARNDVREQMTSSQEGLLPILASVAPAAESVQFLPSIPGGGDLLFVANGAGEAATFAVGGQDAKTVLDAAANFNSQALKDAKQRYGF